ncbi:hypothetical protein KCP69_26660 (plasmid) [Salmonella enterica subsp. enterica]|nr:hypothetical protein KCP69_26660 [Salmonella enterica subsp. enterica]
MVHRPGPYSYRFSTSQKQDKARVDRLLGNTSLHKDIPLIFRQYYISLLASFHGVLSLLTGWLLPRISHPSPVFSL